MGGTQSTEGVGYKVIRRRRETESPERERADALHKEVADRVKALDRAYTRAAKALHEIYEHDYYMQRGYSTFRDYCEMELNLGYDKALALVRVWRGASLYGIHPEVLDEIGWSKARLLISGYVRERHDDLLTAARTLSLREFAEYLKSDGAVSAGDDDAAPRATLAINIPLESPAAKTISDALEIGARIYETRDSVMIVAAICQDWMLLTEEMPHRVDLEGLKAIFKEAYGLDVRFKRIKPVE